MAPGMRVSDGSYEVILSWGPTPIDVRLLPLSPLPTWAQLSSEARMAFIREGQERTPLVLDAAGEERVTHPAAQKTLSFGEAEAQTVLLRSGAFSLSVRRTDKPPRAQGSLWKDRDFSFFKLATVTGMCSAALLLILLISPQVDAAEEPFFRRVADRLEAAIRDPRVIPIIKVPDDAQPPPASTTPASDDRTAARTKRPGSGPLNPLRAGLLGAAADSAGFNALLKGGSSGFDEAMAASDNLQGGPPVADSRGITGIGGRGKEPGIGNGGPWGIGGIGTQRPGGGDGGGNPFAVGGGRRKPVELERPPKVMGGLDRAQIQRVIRQHEAAIRACYETGLSRTPDLEGKVSVQFLIDPSGSVRLAQVLESSLQSGLVEGCILQRIGTWRFPQPRGGGEVEVNFPWIFRPAGGA